MLQQYSQKMRRWEKITWNTKIKKHKMSIGKEYLKKNSRSVKNYIL